MRRSFVVMCAAALLGAAASVQAADRQGAAVKALKETEAQWNKDFAAKDAEKLAAHYTNDAVLIAPGAPPASGIDAIRAALREMVADPELSLKFEASRVEVAKSGDMAYTQGAYTMTMTDPASKKTVNDKGGYVTIYRKQADGSWKAVADIASSSNPPAAK